MKLTKDGLLVWFSREEWDEHLPTFLKAGFRINVRTGMLWSPNRDRAVAEPDYRGAYWVNPGVLYVIGVMPDSLLNNEKVEG